MDLTRQADATAILRQAVGGRRQAADRLFELVYRQLRLLARKYLAAEPKGHTLQPTALVHEAYMKLVDQTRVQWQGRTHFFAVGARAMHRILVDHARRRKAAKAGGRRRRVTMVEHLAAGPQPDDDLLALEDALAKLTELDPQQARMVELRFFGGLSVAEAAEVLGMSKRTAEREWTLIRAWLRRELAAEDSA